MTNICIILARGGSRRIPRKNIRDFRGKPMLAYAITVAKESGIFSHIFVSTDDDEIAVIARQYGAEVHYRRPELSEDNVGTQDVMAEVLKDLGMVGLRFEIACCLYPCVPLLHSSGLVEAMEYLVDADAAYCFSVGEPLHDAGQFYFGYTDAFINHVPLISPMSLMFPVPPERDCDINTEEDWSIAEQKYDTLRGAYVH